MVLLLLLIQSASWAFDCNDIVRTQMRLQVHALNLSNVDKTDSDTGGPYQVKHLECNANTCKVVSESKVRTKYIPDHKDADANGYVRFPDIDPIREKAALNAAARELRLLVKASACSNVRVDIDSKNELALMFESQGSPIKSERFGFSDRLEISSWSRVYSDGKQEVFQF